MRLFWAIELPPDLRSALGEVQRALAAACPGEKVGWVDPERMHLTVKFLGEVDEERVPAVVDAVRGTLKGTEALRLTARGVGTFGGRSPRVVWVGLDGEALPALQDLAGRVEDALVPLGFARDARPFAAHVTLGRVRSARRRQGRGRGRRPPRQEKAGEPGLADVARRTALPETARGAFPVGEVVLFSSSAGKEAGPPVYTALARLALGERSE